MPVRSLNSVVLKWPGREEVLQAARAWARNLQRHDPAVEQVLCVGSCVRGDWGVGSDLDVIVIIQTEGLSPVERRKRYEPTNVPVPADVWVYTQPEWDAFREGNPILWRRLQAEILNLLDP